MSYTPPKLTSRQCDILYLLYRFRALTRPQIQALCNHKNHQLIIRWLNILTELKLIDRYYTRTITAEPATYVINSNGYRYLKQQHRIEKSDLLLRIRKNQATTKEFRQHCCFVAGIYLSLRTDTALSKQALYFYTKTDLYGTGDLIAPLPDAYIAIGNTTRTMKRYFLDVFDDIPPRAMRSRILRYFDYFANQDWQTGTEKPFPAIILIAPTKRMRHHLRLVIRNKIDEEPDLRFYVADKPFVQAQGLTQTILSRVTSE